MLANLPTALPKRRWIVAWIAACLLAFLLLAPASLMGLCLRIATDGRVGLAEPAGSFWSGSGYVTALHEGGDAPIRWRIYPHLVLLGQLKVGVFQGASSEGTITVTPGELRMAGLNLLFPASVLGQVLEPLSRARLGGEFSLRSDTLLLSGNEAAGALRATLSNASSGLVASRALGSYEFSAVGADRKVAFEVKTVKGPLNVAGTGIWTWGQNATFTGSMSAEPGKQSEMSAILSIGGAPNSAGAVDLNWPPRR
jgi:general secretion pathway protein N